MTRLVPWSLVYVERNGVAKPETYLAYDGDAPRAQEGERVGQWICILNLPDLVVWRNNDPHDPRQYGIYVRQ